MRSPEIEISVKFGPNMKQGEDTPIFRYLSRERFLEMVEDGVNVFAHLSMWEDPYEAFLLRAALLHSHEEGLADRSLYGRYKSVYGQCWTYNSKDSDLLWRANGKRGDVVRIKSTVKKLLTSIVDADKSSDKNGLSLLQVGEVKYVEKEELDRMISDRRIVEDMIEDPKRKMEFFFKKRIGFDDEKEVRAIIDVQDDNCLDMDTDTNGSLLRFRVCPEELIDEVLVDPCMGRREYEQLICRTLHRCPNLEIRQSALFKWPNSCYQYVEFPEPRERRFWQMLKDAYGNRMPDLMNRNPPIRSYWEISYTANYSFFFVFDRCEAQIYLLLKRQHENDVFNMLFERRVQIETRLGRGYEGLEWDPLPTRRASKIVLRKCDVSIENEACWDEVADWFVSRMPRFFEVLTTEIY